MQLVYFVLAALLELTGCYLMWLGQKQSSVLMWIGGAIVLAGFGLVLAQAGQRVAEPLLCHLRRYLHCCCTRMDDFRRQAHARQMGHCGC